MFFDHFLSRWPRAVYINDCSILTVPLLDFLGVWSIQFHSGAPSNPIQHYSKVSRLDSYREHIPVDYRSATICSWRNYPWTGRQHGTSDNCLQSPVQFRCVGPYTDNHFRLILVAMAWPVARWRCIKCSVMQHGDCITRELYVSNGQGFIYTP